MSFTSVHPHKGYLNTDFRIHTNCNHSISYKVCDITGSSVLEGIVHPNEPHSVKIPSPGKFAVEFSDGSSVNLIVEDGYKYGGGSYKSCFVHDTCPWVFIVMHDRTYFYNRISEESYVEIISPDLITFVSDDFVLFSNNGDEVKTLYSLKEQRPILCIKDVIYFDSKYVIWKVGDCRLVLFSLEKQEQNIEIICGSYVVKSETKQIFHTYADKLYRINLDEGYTSTFLSEIKGTFITFVGSELCVSYDERTNCELQILNMSTCEVSSLKYEGVLSSVNGNCLIDISKERQSIYQFNLKESGFPNATIEGKYVEINLYPALWDVFYTVKTTNIYKSSDRYNVSDETYLRSLNSKVDHKLLSNHGQAVVNESRFCFYNSRESYVCGKVHSGSGYIEGGQIYVHKDIVHLKSDGATYTLSRNGYWDGKREVNYDYEYFPKYGLVRDKDTGVFKSLSGREYGKSFSCDHIKEYIEFGDIRIYSNGKTLSTKFRNIDLSHEQKYGIRVTKNQNGTLSGDIILCTLNNGDYEERAILQSLFDSSVYENVLFSDNGDQVMYKAEDEAIVMNIVSGECEHYPNMSYIKQINGIRLLFETASSLQPRLINPVTKQYIDSMSMPDFQFVSPNGKLYADTKLADYIEYYYKETGEIISKEDYNKLITRFSYPSGVDKSHHTYKNIIELRKQFMYEHFEYLNITYPKLFNNDSTGKRWNRMVLDEDNNFGATEFVNRIVGVRGIALIRDTQSHSVVARIPLGEPLSHINYVSFSHDSRYVALAGYRSFSHGVFLIYDLDINSTLFFESTNRAVWTTAFSIQGAVAGYTSDPNTFLALNPGQYSQSEKITGRNFLTFSPDGNYFALSNQGYISKYDINGEERDVWGHQPSSAVFVRSIMDDDNLYEFNDLGDTGIAESGVKNSVASVSFSHDNNKLMMVGNDGVIVIRNLNL